jgi:hypothetical protein
MKVDTELEERVQELCSQLSISRSFENVRDKNPSNNLPYHNLYHTLTIVEKVVAGGNYYNLPYRSLRHLATAALYHDYAHSGGKYEDSVNVSCALSKMKEFDLDRSIDRFEVANIIRATEYPYVVEPICIEQRIIRDADLMQGFCEETWKEMILIGLRAEMSIKLSKEFSVCEFGNAQIDFLKSCKTCTEWGHKEFYNKGNVYKLIANIRSEMNNCESI